MRSDPDLNFASAGVLAGRLRRREVSSEELVRNTLARIDETQPLLNAFTHVDADGALAAARDCDARLADALRHGRALPALHGIPVSVKELIEVAGLPCRYGSQTMAGHVPDRDAPSVARLRAAGAVIVGMTNTSEFGFRGYTDNLLHGVTRNPWDLTRTPGGSSGGAAASVAAGVTPVALATDGGGSIRNPAGFTGLVGIKAQFGRVPVFPASATPTLAHVGPIARCVEDAALLLRAVSGPDDRDWTSLQPPLDATPGLAASGPLRVAFSPTLGFGRLEPDVEYAVRTAVTRLEAVTGPITPVDTVCEDESELLLAEFIGGCSARLGTAVDRHPEQVDPSLLRLVQAFRTRTVVEHTGLLLRRAALRERMRQCFTRWDVLLTPMTPCVAWRIGERAPAGYEGFRLWTFFGYPFNLTGQPAGTLPCGLSPQGLPIGLQVVVRPQHEPLLIDLMQRFEAVLGGTALRPRLDTGAGTVR
jgi:aspartyl-tRNA(Asn)/glutamyl-tRNA(Gln) amidotransferase subunit A